MKDFFPINGQEYRVEVNMIAAENFEARACIPLSEFESLCVKQSNKGKGIDTNYVLIWLYVSLQAGEELEGRKFDLTFDQMKAHIRPGQLALFAGIFTKQYFAPDQQTQQPSNKVKKKRQNFLSKLFNR